MRIRLLFLVFIISLQGCAISTVNQTVWPTELPPQSYFEDQYGQDAINANYQAIDQYLIWVMRFYQGWELYPNGWNKVTDDLLFSIKEPEIAQEIEEKMTEIGLLISGEWAKNNETRMINTRHVSIWGNALLKSIEQGETMAIINRVHDDVEDLLAKRISASVITENRFYSEEDIFKDIN